MEMTLAHEPPPQGHMTPPSPRAHDPPSPRRTEQEVKFQLHQLHLQLAELRNKNRPDRPSGRGGRGHVPGNVQQFAQRVS